MSTIPKSIYSAVLLAAMTAAQAQAPMYVEASLQPIGDNEATGSVRIDKEGNKLTMHSDLRKLAPGNYSLTIHEKGDCGDNSKNAGGVLKGGDLGTETADEKGTGHIDHPLTNLSLNDRLSGRAVILSQDGKPVACGILLPPRF